MLKKRLSYVKIGGNNMKGTNLKMKIRNLKIKGLYNLYNYDIDFFDDVTFLHGSNGCGKTTILSIINNIINSDINYLMSFVFKEINLMYYDPNENIHGNIIYEKDSDKINLKFNNNTYDLTYLNQKKVIKSIDYEVIKTHKEIDEILNQIKNLFPKVFLPLIRKDKIQNERNRINHIIVEDTTINWSDIDKALKHVEKIIFKHYHEVLEKLSQNDKYLRDNIVSDILVNDMNTHSMVESFLEMSEESLNKLIVQYKESIKTINNLTGLSLNSSQIEELLYDFQDYKKSDKISISLLINLYKIIQAKRIIKLTTEYNNKKSYITRKIIHFKNIINEFFSMGSIKKTMIINSNLNQITFSTDNKGNDFKLTQLSSGEKQIFLFFVHLFFNLEDNIEGIFIIDEPEMSLHIGWQKIFVKTILDINDKLQLIFATHSPEIISDYLRKSVRLVPKNYVESK